ncbi:MAG TPA: hypothetical protein VGQ83_29135 [Polyangia bacterium]
MRLAAVFLLLATLGCGPTVRAPAPAATPASAPVRAPDLSGPLGLIFSPAPDPAALLAKLEAARAAGPPAERALVDRLVRALRAVQGGAPPTSAFRELLAVTRDLGRLYPDHFDTQLRVASTIGVAAASAEDLGLDAAALRVEAVARARALALAFPREPRAHGQLGHTLWMSGAAPLEALRPYARCLDLDPAQASCRKAHRALVDSYERPRCETADLRPDLAAHAAATAPPGQRMTFGGAPLYLDATPIIARDDVVAAVLEDADATLELTPGGRGRFTAATTRLAQSGGRIALVAGGRVLLAAQVMTPITGARLRIAGAALDALCARVEHRRVPAALRRGP